VLLIDASRVQGRVLVMAQSFRLSNPTERVGLDGVQEHSYPLDLVQVNPLPVGKISRTVCGEINSPL
jgi:hypothetical protein